MKEKFYLGLSLHDMKLIRREMAELAENLAEHAAKGFHLDSNDMECYYVARSLCDRIDEHLKDLNEPAV